jgi:hypothetical protein
VRGVGPRRGRIEEWDGGAIGHASGVGINNLVLAVDDQK